MSDLARELNGLRDALTAANQNLERERAAHRKTHRRESRSRLERENVEEAAAQHASEVARLHHARLLDGEERNVVLQHLGNVQSLAQVRTAELAALRAKRQLEVEEQNLLLLWLAAADELAAVSTEQLERLRAQRELERQEHDALLRDAAEWQRQAADHGAAEERLRVDRDERDALLRKVAQAQESVNAHVAQTLVGQAEGAGLRRQLADLEEANRALLEFVAALQHRCAAVESAFADILSSHSWRFTAPVRRVMARIRPHAAKPERASSRSDGTDETILRGVPRTHVVGPDRVEL
jgi:hypothetical protein